MAWVSKMNNKLKKALEKLIPEAQLVYATGKLPDRFVLAFSRLTPWEQEHMCYEPDPDDPNHALRYGLVDDDGNMIEPAEDRKADIQAVTDIFLDDQRTVRETGKLGKSR